MFNKKLKEYKEKQAEIRDDMARYDQADERFYLTANMVLNLAQKAEKIFESSEIPEKRQLLNFLLQNLKLRDKKLLFELKTPFDTVLLANKCSSMLPLQDAFRTIDWRRVGEEIEPFVAMMKQVQGLLTVNA